MFAITDPLWPKKKTNTQPLEKKLWLADDKLLKNMDAAEYKHIVLGLIFLKYTSGAFEEIVQSIDKQINLFSKRNPNSHPTTG